MPALFNLSLSLVAKNEVEIFNPSLALPLKNKGRVL